MKNLIIFPLLVTVIFLFSCNHKNNSVLPTELTRAESLMYSHPDSALQILERMQAPPLVQPLSECHLVLADDTGAG